MKMGYIPSLYTFGRVLIEQLEVDDWVCVDLAAFQMRPHLFCILRSPGYVNHMQKHFHIHCTCTIWKILHLSISSVK